MMHVNGIDVSDWQGAVNWKAVHDAGYSFASAKATEGTGNVQDTFAANCAGIEAADMLMCAYHFMDWTQDGVAQAEHFLSVYQPKTGDLPPMLDCEGTTNLAPMEAVDKIAAFIHRVEEVTKKRCLLYMGYYFWQDALGATDGFDGHPLWLAQYVADPNIDAPSIPHVWPGMTFWQYSETGNVAGISPCDLDWFIGDINALRALRLELP